MEDWEIKAKEWEEQARLLWDQWEVEPKYKEIFHSLVCSCYGLKMLLDFLLDLQSSLKGQTGSLRAAVMSRVLINELTRLSDAIRKMVPNITDEEFEDWFKTIVQYLDDIRDSVSLK